MILVVFLAGYLSENRDAPGRSRTRASGRCASRRCRTSLPMVAMWAIALGIVVIQRDLGAALLFFGVFLALLYVATARVEPGRHRARPVRRSAASLMALLFDHVRTRVDIWIDPFADPLGAGLPGRPGAPRVRARRPGRGRPRRRAARRSAERRRSRRSTPTSRWRRSARSSGSLGVVAILGPLPRRRRARPADRRGGRRRLPVAAGGRALAGHRRPGASSSRRATSRSCR